MDSNPRAEVLSRIERAIVQDLTPVRPLPGVRLLAAAFVAVVGLLSAAGVALVGTGAVRIMGLGTAVVPGAILAAVAILLAVCLARQLTPGSLHRVRPACLLAVLPAIVILSFLLLLPWSASGLSKGPHCLAFGLRFSVPAGLVLWFLTRRAVFLSPALAGATAGLLAGLTGTILLQFGCTVVNAPHFAFWHGGIPILAGLAGFVLGKVLFRS